MHVNNSPGNRHGCYEVMVITIMHYKICFKPNMLLAPLNKTCEDEVM